jgi:hypothetical protein
MLLLPITEQANEQEWDKIITIAHNNGFPTQAIHNLKKKAIAKQKKSPNLNEERQNKKRTNKWVTFTYYSPLVRKVTNFFRNTNINIALGANTTIYQQLAWKSDNTNPSSVYEIKCNTCNRAYVGQSGRLITIRHKEHIRYIKITQLQHRQHTS